ncbi:MAG: glycosyltransferase [Candidatus Marinimicrobia bacterium]|nr:glycosyltransferase [Candidatus Neomarinimicrobiota bacterium]
MPLYDEAGIDTITLSNSRWNPLIPLKLILTLYKEKPDILVVQQEVMAVMGSIAGWLTRVPAILVKVPYTMSQVSGWVYSTLRIAAKFSNYMLTQSPQCTKELLSIGIPNNKICMIPSGASVPGRLSESEKIRLRKELGLNENDLVLFSAARLHKQKGHSLLLDVFHQVRASVPNAKLLIAGSGPEEESLKRKTKQLQLEESVKFLGYRADVDRLLSIVDVNALPSLSEGLGIATIQALGMGIPVVAFDVGAVSEGVIHNETGYLLDLGDVNGFAGAIIDLLQNPTKREELGLNAEEHVKEKYSIRKSIEAMEKVFLALLEENHNEVRSPPMVIENQEPELTTAGKKSV